MKSIVFMVFLLMVAIPISDAAQLDTVRVPGDIFPGEGNLNKAVQAALNSGKLTSKVFKLEPNSRYVLTGAIIVPTGMHLTIVAPESGTTQAAAPPQIVWTVKPPATWPDYTIDTTRNYFFNCYGDLTLKNVWVLCADVLGDRVSSCIIFQDDHSDPDGRRCNFEGVILDYFPCPPTAGGTVTVNCKNFRGLFKNTYWKNNTDNHLRYYGRAVSFPFSSTGLFGDSVIFENCTFANIGYVLMQESGEYYDYVKFNHCTFLNVMMYPLESGWWNKLSVTNCIFINTWMFGLLPLFTGTNDPEGAILRIDSLSKIYYDGVHTFPYTEQDRRILFSNSCHYLQKWIRDWMWNNSYSVSLRQRSEYDAIPEPQPMLSPGTLRFFDSTSNGQKVFPYMNRANLYDSTDPGFLFPPSDTSAIKSFIFRRWYDSSDTLWAWKPENSHLQRWPLEENLAYSNETIKTAGIGSFPLGDLYRWWPEKYQQWKVQEAAENDTINKWLHYGFCSVVGVTDYLGIPEKFELSQNYPNPFNPTTIIRYQIPVTSRTSLKVYNLLGKELVTLFEGVRQPGNYEAVLNGRGLSSGIYLCRLSATNFSMTKKLILLK